MSAHHPGRIEEIEGTVKWFAPRKGFGFVIGPDQQDIFVHFSVIEGEGFRVLKDGSKIIYSAEETDRGWKATAVKRVEEEPEVMITRRRNYTRTPRR